MSQRWHSLYIRHATAESVAETLRTLLAAHDYAPYDPFPGGTGTPPGLRTMARLFVAPARDDWVRVLGEVDAGLLPELSNAAGGTLLAAWLTGDSSGFAVYAGGTRHESPEAFAPFLRDGATPADIERALAGELPAKAQGDATSGADALPPELQQLARTQGVDAGKANAIVARLSDSLFGRLARQTGDASAEQEQARAVLMGGGRDIWHSVHGQRVQAMAGVLALPANWRVPAWDDVRDAYHALRMRERYPRMAMLPGDRESLAAVPDIVAYIPVYMGHR